MGLKDLIRGKEKETMEQENTVPPTPFVEAEVEQRAPDQYGPETERQDDIPSPVHEENEKEETPKEPKEKQEQKARGRRVLSAKEWEEKNTKAFEDEAAKMISGIVADDLIRKNRKTVTQLRNYGYTDADIAEVFVNVYGLDVDARDIQKAMKPKRKRKKKTDTETPAEAENIITVPEDTAEEAM